MSIINEKLLKEFPMNKTQIEDVIELLNEGNTVPFIDIEKRKPVDLMM